MAVTQYKTLNATSDISNTRTLLHESIPLTGTIVSGTYSDNNIKNYTHGQFQSVYDYPYLSSSANHIFDISMGYDEGSSLSGSSATQNAKKINMYNQMSQVLLGFTGSTNAVRKFELDLTLDNSGVMNECYFLNFSRLITKDQIKKGTFSITLGTGSYASPFSLTKTLTDASASSTGGTLNTLGGDYGVLFSTDNVARGLVFYESGVAVLSTSSFDGRPDFLSSSASGNEDVAEVFVSSSISGACDALRHRVQNISFNNTTEINSSIYFCRIPSNDFNHSSNPTYLSASTIRVKDVASDPPISYITTVGLYASDGELLAVAKLSEPLRKDPTNELTLRVRLDY
jgi:hypothetical protein